MYGKKTMAYLKLFPRKRDPRQETFRIGVEKKSLFREIYKGRKVQTIPDYLEF